MLPERQTSRYIIRETALNQAYANGAVILAAFDGLVFQSWWAFVVGGVALLGLNVVGGNMRLSPARR